MTVLKRLKRYLSAVFKLGRTARLAKRADRASQEQAEQIKDMAASFTSDLDAALCRHEARMNACLNARLAEHTLYDSELSRRLDRLMMSEGGRSSAVTFQDNFSDSEGMQLFLDMFYARLENRFRGSREEIAARLRVYLPEVEAAMLRTGGKPALDLGCGRGEWLELLMENGLEGVGVDLNVAQIAEARDKGLDVREEDACAALANAADESVAVISAHHLVEHLSFPKVAWITREAARVLAPGGLLIYETPNPHNILVGSASFHNDPTHLKPLTDPVLRVLLETVGYDPIETRFLNPHERLDEFLSRRSMDPELAHLLFGPQDLAVIGQKPFGEA